MTFQTRIIIGTAMMVFAAAFGVAGFFIMRRSRRLHATGTHADGVIVGCNKKLVDSMWLYFPEIEFRSQDGDTHVFTASAGGSQMPRVGRSVRVSYLPSDPEDADVSSFGGISFFGIVMFLFAVGFFGMSVIFYSGLVEQP
jgi:hypothetical protein